MSTDAAASWQNSTVLIRNEWGEIGTGFFLLDPVVSDASGTRVRALIVTNKHVLSADPDKRRAATKVHISLVRKAGDGALLPLQGDFPLNYTNDGTPLWREHPQPEVDVLAFDVTAMIAAFPGWVDSLNPPNALCSDENWKTCDVRAGQGVLVIGYPEGIREAATNRPIVRHGIISSDPQLPFSLEGMKWRSHQPPTVRGFLVDCPGLRGSSGSPVILDAPPSGVRSVSSSGHEARIIPAPYVIGVVAEGWPAEGYERLTVAFNAETIRETLQLFPRDILSTG
jgi:hypothetical protein